MSMSYFNHAWEVIQRPGRYIQSRGWKPSSRLIIRGDSSGWVLDEFAKELGAVVEALGIPSADSEYYKACRNQVVFFTSKYFLLKWRKSTHRVTFPYFHGDPRIDPSLWPLFRAVVSRKDEIARIQVSHTQIEGLLLDAGISKQKVHKIPIAINLDHFSLTTSKKRSSARQRLGIPKYAVVVGSFQKDGLGFKIGKEPKMIKGPDTLLEVAAILKGRIDGLHFLLTGPARGFVKAGLERIGIPFTHVVERDYRNLETNYHAIDAYLVTSREEGGPRAILEAMATGVPIVSTRVGQAVDLIIHENNGWLSDVEDAEALAYWTELAVGKEYSRSDMQSRGRVTAEENCWAAQMPLWRNFFSEIVVSTDLTNYK